MQDARPRDYKPRYPDTPASGRSVRERTRDQRWQANQFPSPPSVDKNQTMGRSFRWLWRWWQNFTNVERWLFVVGWLATAVLFYACQFVVSDEYWVSNAYLLNLASASTGFLFGGPIVVAIIGRISHRTSRHLIATDAALTVVRHADSVAHELYFLLQNELSRGWLYDGTIGPGNVDDCENHVSMVRAIGSQLLDAYNAYATMTGDPADRSEVTVLEQALNAFIARAPDEGQLRQQLARRSDSSPDITGTAERWNESIDAFEQETCEFASQLFISTWNICHKWPVPMPLWVRKLEDIEEDVLENHRRRERSP